MDSLAQERAALMAMVIDLQKQVQTQKTDLKTQRQTMEFMDAKLRASLPQDQYNAMVDQIHKAAMNVYRDEMQQQISQRVDCIAAMSIILDDE